MTTKQKPSTRIGRPTVAAQPGERVTLGIQVQADVKNRINRAAASAGRSLSKEAEMRLERTLNEEDQFGGPELLNMARLMTAAFHRGGMAGARARGHPRWTPATWMDDPTCYIAAITAVADALVTAGPVGLKYPDNVPLESRALQDKIHGTFAQMIARGRDIKVTREAED